MRWRWVLTGITLSALGCTSSGTPDGSGSTTGSSAGGSGSTSSTGGTGGGMGVGGGTVFAGGDCPTDLGLSGAETLPNVRAEVVGSTARILFDPRAAAKDYRVYVLPAKGDVSGDTVQNATYRCAGTYEVVGAIHEEDPLPQSYAVHTIIDSDVEGFKRSAADATLGYVFTTPAPDRVPVYALGDSAPDGDNDCYFQRWPESRVKVYTTSEAERTQLLDQHYRDDGVAFYVPAAASAETRQVYAIADQALYFTDDAEKAARGAGATTPFVVLAAAVAGAEPLKRVYYSNGCGRSHDELVATEARFRKAYDQGPTQPVAELHFAGLTADTTLVVEALDAACPYQGIVSPMPRPAGNNWGVDYEAYLTPDEIRAATATGEIFVGGTGDAASKPHAIARACVAVKPAAAPTTEWSYDGTKAETYTPTEGVPGDQALFRFESPTFNIEFNGQTPDQWALGSIFGELWALHADPGADVGSVLRLTPKQTPTLSDTGFLHATMEVDTMSTFRRYPQMLISSATWPVQANLVNAATVVLQTFNDGPTEGQIEFCDHRDWAVNNQCPRWDLHRVNDGSADFLAPNMEPNGVQGLDRTVRFDAFVSTSRVYFYLNATPYGCVDLPPGKLPAGPATVTFGDALYHSGVDLGVEGGYSDWFPFHHAHMQVYTARHYSNLGFDSNVPKPTWDEARFPCAAADALMQ